MVASTDRLWARRLSIACSVVASPVVSTTAVTPLADLERCIISLCCGRIARPATVPDLKALEENKLRILQHRLPVGIAAVLAQAHKYRGHAISVAYSSKPQAKITVLGLDQALVETAGANDNVTAHHQRRRRYVVE